MKKLVWIFLLMLCWSVPQRSAGQFVTHHNAIYQGEIAQPAKGTLIMDPNFHTPVTRLTDARTDQIHGLFPDYSKRQAWNSDESLLLLRSGWGDTYLFNGQNYQFIKKLEGVGGEDVFWHPANPHLVLYAPDSILRSYNVTTDEILPIHDFAPYTWANTKGEGNVSNDGRYYAVVGQMYNYSTGETTFKDILVYDLQNDAIIATMPLPSEQLIDFDWVSVSPLGNYVVVDYADEMTSRYHGIEVYDRNLNFLWQKPLGAGHSDFGLDAAGNEVLIMDVYKDDPNLTYINKYMLADGTETPLLSISPFFDVHHSCRAFGRPGWVYVSTFDFSGRLTDSEASWLPFEDEVFAVNMDGSGSVQRYAHHHSQRYSVEFPDGDLSTYYAEPHATASPSGNRILFGSNWRIRIEEDYSVDAYLIDLTNMLTGDPLVALKQETVTHTLYPNPVADHLTIESLKPDENNRMVISDLAGRTVMELALNRPVVTVDLSEMQPGVYFYRITDSKGSLPDRGRFVKL